MGEVVNLRMARKAKRRADAEKTAAANRALHGRSGAQRTGDRIDRARAERILDGARLEGA